MTSHVVLVAINGQVFVCQQRALQTGSVNDPPRSGRLHVTTPLEDRHMITSSHHHRFIRATKLLQRLREATRTRISVDTDRNKLRAARLRAQRPYIGVSLTQRHRVARLDWLRQHNRWVSQQDNHVVIFFITLVTSRRPTELTRSNGLPDHQLCHL